MLAPNTILQNRYLVESLLGKGGMGAVYKVVDQRFGSTVALKQTLVGGEALLKAFQREARLLNGLRHGALPVVIDYFTEATEAYLVMQYIPGEDLAKLLEEKGRAFAVEDVVKWADQLLDLLDYLHNHQPPVIHRDIKPHNLKLAERGQIILLDFGLAKGSAVVSADSAAVSVLGYTPSYAPFEQIQGSGTDPRSDLYSLSATLYHLITGATPVDALTRTAALLNSRPDPLKPADELNPEVTPEIAAVLMQAMELNPDRRPQTAAEMRQALREATYRPAIIGQETKPAAKRKEATIIPDAAGTVIATPDPATQQGARITVAASAPLAPVTSAKAGGAKRGIAGGVIALVIVGVIAGILWNKAGTGSTPLAPPPVAASASKGPAENPNSSSASGAPSLKSLALDLVTVDAQGTITAHNRGEAKYFTQDLTRGVTLDMAFIPGGTFVMGSPDAEKFRFGEEGPQRTVEVPSFYMGKFEITQAQWQVVASLPKVKIYLNPSPSNFEGVDRPVQSVSWSEAVEFCDRLSQKTGRKWRLPSEAEWEYACRAGTKTPFYYGDNINSDLANYDGQAPYGDGSRGILRKQTTAVGKTGYANAFGLYDMHGNMWEWCLDPWHEGYRGAPLDGSAWESGGVSSLRIVRGGAWNRPANNCRSAYRLKEGQDKRYDVIGFRVVISASDIPTQQ